MPWEYFTTIDWIIAGVGLWALAMLLGILFLRGCSRKTDRDEPYDLPEPHRPPPPCPQPPELDRITIDGEPIVVLKAPTLYAHLRYAWVWNCPACGHLNTQAHECAEVPLDDAPEEISSRMEESLRAAGIDPDDVCGIALFRAGPSLGKGGMVWCTKCEERFQAC